MSEAAETVGLALQLRQATRDVHGQAERSGVMADLVHGRADVMSYALLLRSLLPAYQALEAGLEAHRDHPIIGAFALAETYRAESILHDLTLLIGMDWPAVLPELPAAAAYARAVAAAADGGGERLIAHAYVRTLGDLSGGQIIAKLLLHSLGAPAQQLQFHAFPLIADIAAFKACYCARLDVAGTQLASTDAVLDAARSGFAHNISVAQAVSYSAAAAARSERASDGR